MIGWSGLLTCATWLLFNLWLPQVPRSRAETRMAALPSSTRQGGGELAMVQLLRAHGADGNAQSDIGYTELIWAASCGHAEVVSTLEVHGLT
jgi:ankyrin repeat protein